MIDLVYDLDKRYKRPSILIHGVRSLIDTGAFIPVFSFPFELMQKVFNAEMVKRNVPYGGFGGETSGDLVTVHDFNMGEFSFRDLDVMLPQRVNRETTFPFVLSATMFYDIDYDIQNSTKKLILHVPNSKALKGRVFSIEQLRGELTVKLNGTVLRQNRDTGMVENCTQVAFDNNDLTR